MQYVMFSRANPNLKQLERNLMFGNASKARGNTMGDTCYNMFKYTYAAYVRARCAACGVLLCVGVV